MSAEATTTELIVNQTTFYLAFLVTLASAGAIGLQVYRGLANRVKKSKEEVEARSKREHEDTRRYVDNKLRDLREEFVAGANILREHQNFNDHNIADVKQKTDYLAHKMIDRFFDKEFPDPAEEEPEAEK